MRIFIMQHKRSKIKKAIVDKTLTEALTRARWMEKNTIFINAYTINELLINPNIWKQPKPTTPNRIKTI